MRKFKTKDIVLNEWREQYDRELDTGVVIKEESSDHYLVARISKDKDGWYFTGQDVHERPGSMLTPSDTKFEDTGLEV
jgi:hypothetical protein